MNLDIYNRAKKIITDFFRLDKEEIQPHTHMVNDLGADSLALIELAFKLSEEFSIKMIEPDENRLIFENLVNYIEKETIMNDNFPEFIQKLPEADVPAPGIHGRVLQGNQQQVIFWNIEPQTLAPHKHGAQYGIIVKGEATLIMEGKNIPLTKGTSFFIPQGIEHSLIVHTPLQVIDIFDDPSRVKAKVPKP